MKILLTEYQIQKCVISVAKKLNRLANQNKEKEIVLVGLLKEVFIFIADLSRNLNFDYTVEFINVIRQKNYFVSEIKTELKEKLKDKIVIVIDTLYKDRTNYITDLIKNYSENVYSCVLLKKENFKTNKNTELVGYNKIPNVNIFGYGIGNMNLSGLYILDNVNSEEEYIQIIQRIQKEIRLI